VFRALAPEGLDSESLAPPRRMDAAKCSWIGVGATLPGRFPGANAPRDWGIARHL